MHCRRQKTIHGGVQPWKSQLKEPILQRCLWIRSYSKLQRKTSLNQKISMNLTSHDKLRCLKWIILNGIPLNCFRLQELWMKYQVLNGIKRGYVWMKTVMLSAIEFCLWTKQTESCLQGHRKAEGFVGSTSKVTAKQVFFKHEKKVQLGLRAVTCILQVCFCPYQ